MSADDYLHSDQFGSRIGGSIEFGVMRSLLDKVPALPSDNLGSYQSAMNDRMTGKLTNDQFFDRRHADRQKETEAETP